MARSGRFGKYGDIKRKEKIRKTRLTQHDRAGKLLTGREAGKPGHGRRTEGGGK